MIDGAQYTMFPKLLLCQCPSFIGRICNHRVSQQSVVAADTQAIGLPHQLRIMRQCHIQAKVSLGLLIVDYVFRLT